MSGEHDLRILGRADHLAFLLPAGRGAGREFGHHAVHGAARGLQRLQGFVQPGAVAHGHPGRAAGLCAGLQREVQPCGLFEEVLFEQAFEDGAQARRLGERALRQRHALPRQRARGHHGHDLAGTARVGQQCGAGAGLADGVVAVGRERVAVFGGGRLRARGQG